MTHLAWPRIEAVADRLLAIGGFHDRLRRRRVHDRRERDEFRSRIEAKADAWMATAPYRDVERIGHYAVADAFEVVELLVLAALEDDLHATDDFSATVDIFANRVVETMRMHDPQSETQPSARPSGIRRDARFAIGGLAAPRA